MTATLQERHTRVHELSELLLAGASSGSHVEAHRQSIEEDLATANRNLQAIGDTDFAGDWCFGIDGTMRYSLEVVEGGVKYTSAKIQGHLLNSADWLEGDLQFTDGRPLQKIRLCKGPGVIISQLSPDGHSWDAPQAAHREAWSAGHIAVLQAKLAAWEWLDTPVGLVGDEIVIKEGSVDAVVEEILPQLQSQSKVRARRTTDGSEVTLVLGQYDVKLHRLPWWAYSTKGVATKAQLALGPCIFALRCTALTTLYAWSPRSWWSSTIAVRITLILIGACPCSCQPLPQSVSQSYIFCVFLLCPTQLMLRTRA